MVENEKKKLLIVDDSEIDRAVLTSILKGSFDILEADNGYSAMEVLQQEYNALSAVLLDVSMPVLDGFSVLRLMKDNKMDRIPVFLITAEATKDNVQKAMQFNVVEFIRKPFDREEILKRLKIKLGYNAYYNLRDITSNDIVEMKEYISRLESIYKSYLSNFGRDFGHYRRMAGLMKILLAKYNVRKELKLEGEIMEIISGAAAFCDIGFMIVPNKFNVSEIDGMDDELYQSHTKQGARIIRLNTSKQCEFFVHICADMCLHHHQKYDGSGFPDRIFKNDNSAYTQMCRIVDLFDGLFYKYREHNELQFEFVMSELAHDRAGVSPEIFSMFSECKFNVVMYYNMKVFD